MALVLGTQVATEITLSDTTTSYTKTVTYTVDTGHNGLILLACRKQEEDQLDIQYDSESIGLFSGIDGYNNTKTRGQIGMIWDLSPGTYDVTYDFDTMDEGHIALMLGVSAQIPIDDPDYWTVEDDLPSNAESHTVTETLNDGDAIFGLVAINDEKTGSADGDATLVHTAMGEGISASELEDLGWVVAYGNATADGDFEFGATWTGVENTILMAVVLEGVGAVPTITSDAAEVGFSAAAPTVVRGSLAPVLDGAEMALSASAPDVVLGSMAASSDNAEMSLSASAPDVVLGSTVASSDNAEMALSASAPDVVLGSLAVTPDSPSLVAMVATAPAVVYGSTVASSDNAEMALSASAPDVVLGSLVASSDNAEMAFSVTAPSIAGTSLLLRPSAASLGLTAAAPGITIIGGATILPDNAEMSLSASAPDVVYGSLAVMPDSPSLVAMVATAPAVVYGSLAVTPDSPSLVAMVATAPAVVYGSLVLDSEPAVVAFTATEPQSAVDVVVSMTAAEFVLAVLLPGVINPKTAGVMLRVSLRSEVVSSSLRSAEFMVRCREVDLSVESR